MTAESQDHSAPPNVADTVDDASNGAAPALEPSGAMPRFVQATLVRSLQPRQTASQEDADAARQVRAARRQELLGIFFIHISGTLRAKRERAYPPLQRVVDPVERDRLHSLLRNLWDAAQSAPPAEGM